MDNENSENENLNEIENENEVEEEVTSDPVDYTSLLEDISSDVSSLILQLDNLNDNVVILNDNVKFGISLIFCIVVFLIIKCAHHLLITVLGLGKV